MCGGCFICRADLPKSLTDSYCALCVLRWTGTTLQQRYSRPSSTARSAFPKKPPLSVSSFPPFWPPFVFIRWRGFDAVADARLVKRQSECRRGTGEELHTSVSGKTDCFRKVPPSKEGGGMLGCLLSCLLESSVDLYKSRISPSPSAVVAEEESARNVCCHKQRKKQMLLPQLVPHIHQRNAVCSLLWITLVILVRL